MKKNNQSIINTLFSEIEFVLNQVKELDKKLKFNLKNIDDHSHLVTAAYHLSGIYSCLEDIFFKIAKVFENRVENPSSWHRELIERMRINVRNIRPSVISEKTFPILDEMRRFRHVFRSSYMFSLKKPQIELLAQQWNDGKDTVEKEIKRFLNKIQK
ncbi:MAG: hypothetical protein ABIA04_04665 [Pseudomonadota bacterium]